MAYTIEIYDIMLDGDPAPRYPVHSNICQYDLAGESVDWVVEWLAAYEIPPHRQWFHLWLPRLVRYDTMQHWRWRPDDAWRWQDAVTRRAD